MNKLLYQYFIFSLKTSLYRGQTSNGVDFFFETNKIITREHDALCAPI